MALSIGGINFSSILSGIGSTLLNSAKTALTQAVGQRAPDIFSGLVNKGFDLVGSKLGLGGSSNLGAPPSSIGSKSAGSSSKAGGVTGGGTLGGMVDRYGKMQGAQSETDRMISQIEDPQERLALQIQRQMHKQNQMFTMCTNMQQVDHDTKKAAIQNFRV
jgi:hypothetical protein